MYQCNLTNGFPKLKRMFKSKNERKQKPKHNTV